MQSFVTLKPGLAASGWLRVERVALICGWGIAVLTAIFVWLTLAGFAAFSLIAAVSFVIAAIGISIYNTSVLSLSRQRAEAKLGYTTIPEPHQPELKLVLPLSGMVVRDVDEGPMGKSAYRELALNDHPRRV